MKKNLHSLTFILALCLVLVINFKLFSQNAVIRIPKKETKNSNISQTNKISEATSISPTKSLTLPNLKVGASIYLPGSILSAFGSSIGYGVNLDGDFAEVYDNLTVYGDASFIHGSNTLSNSSNFSGSNYSTSTTRNSNLIPIMLGARYHLTDKIPLYFGFGLGYGLYNVTTKYSSSSNIGYSSSESSSLSGFGYNFHIGFNLTKISFQIKQQNISIGENGITLPINNLAISAHYRIN
ncbi:hypothetical protein EOJ36_08410 [Sandaracinomonas limnophila]|uniref:Outer membrane protein beta-barrel domain-containing protein n=1 Tax=Sandaracinomonas limnophila TaxID=1862386 RepID=A0A437PRZ8_9BACT|nr:outer membrane beta-barrel protein [Sandaracinomonas limnophila]RVU25017.1 hypothetical protein EOJ36_08410 [Sandaracinomonas limnophila]